MQLPIIGSVNFSAALAFQRTNNYRPNPVFMLLSIGSVQFFEKDSSEIATVSGFEAEGMPFLFICFLSRYSNRTRRSAHFEWSATRLLQDFSAGVFQFPVFHRNLSRLDLN